MVAITHARPAASFMALEGGGVRILTLVGM
jgi:hypothetical protein